MYYSTIIIIYKSINNYVHIHSQYYNNGNYCPDFIGQQDDVYHILVATDHYNIESVLMHIKNRRDWRLYGRYCSIYGTSSCMDYNTERCQFYTSLYRSVIGQ